MSNNINNNMDEIEFSNQIRRIGGSKEKPQRGITVPPWVIRNFNFEQGEEVKVIIRKTDGGDDK